MGRTSPPIREALDGAIRKARSDMGFAVRSIRQLRQRALRTGNREGAVACLVALKLLASVQGLDDQVLRIANKLVIERGSAHDFYTLGQIWQQRRAFRRARSLYEQALVRSLGDASVRHEIMSALASLPP